MGWTIALLGIILAAVNGPLGLMLFIVGIFVVVLSTGERKPVPIVARSVGALVLFIVGVLTFMATVAAIVGAAATF